MTARETTLGALTAADLGKRVRLASGEQGTLKAMYHHPGPAKVVTATLDRVSRVRALTTPVTVYEKAEA